MKKAIIITLAAILSLGLILAGVGLIITKGNLGAFFAEDVRTQKRIDETQTVTSLKLSIASDDIELYPSEDGKLYIEYWDSESRPYSYSINDGTAELKQQSGVQHWWDFSRNINKTVKVFAPESVTDTLSIQLASGSVKSKGYVPAVQSLKIHISSGNASIGQCTAAYADIKMASGNITFTGITADNIDVDISSGNLKLSDSHINTKLDIRLSSGNVDINNCEISSLKSKISSGTMDAKALSASSIDCASSSGNIRLRLNGAAADYAIDIDLSSGHALLDIGGQTIKAASSLEWGSGSKKVHCKTSSGDISIYFAL